jgi:hypothetical protein
MDDDGEYVAAWVNDDPGQLQGVGVYVTLYNGVRWDENARGNRTKTASPQPIKLQVTDNSTAHFPSVARDGDGDFVVTWSQFDAVGGWNVWARRFDATGNPFAVAYDAAGNPRDDGRFLVNTETDDVQRYSTVAMDEDGDFVIAWQSLGQDDDGWGVYGQRFSPQGERLGGTNEIQGLSFDGRDVNFRLSLNGASTDIIRYRGNAFAIVDTVRDQIVTKLGLDVQVAAVNAREMLIEFVGKDGLTDQNQLRLTITTAGAADAVDLTTKLDGDGGEFLVNDTTEGNQMFPTIAMAAEGEFVVTWTSDQNGDQDVYAKQFVSNDGLRTDPEDLQTRVRVWKSLTGELPPVAFGVSTDDPLNTPPIVTPGSGYDGVVEVILPGLGSGSGSLLYSGRHILTAAHVVDIGALLGVPAVIPAPTVDVAFDLPTGRTTISSSQIFIHPGYLGDISTGYDVAIIVLPEDAPTAAERYQLYRGSDEFNRRADLVGYGTYGQGLTGVVTADGNKRLVQNEFEVFGDRLNSVPPADFSFPVQWNFPVNTVLSYDFDSGVRANDAFGQLYGINDLGLGSSEGSSSFGDSGGPSFINGQIAGIVSGGVELASADVDGVPGNVSFGVIGFHTRVSAFADYIDSIVQSSGGEFLVNDTTDGDQKWSSVGMDADGDFAISWTSYGQDGVGSGYGGGAGGVEGVFAKRYNADGTEVQVAVDDPANPGLFLPDPLIPGQALTAPAGEFQVNTFAEGVQQHSAVAMDADGDFTITWESYQDPGAPPENYGIYAQRYAANDKYIETVVDAAGLIGPVPSTQFGPNGELGGELPINGIKDGDQRYPAIAMDDTGDAVIVWETDGEDVFHAWLQKSDDDAGPMVADVINVIAKTGGGFDMERVFNLSVLESGVTEFLVSFGENLIAERNTLVDSVTNRNNWSLFRNGALVDRGVKDVEFGLNQSQVEGLVPGSTNKYEAILTFDGNPTLQGNQPLGSGVYTLVLYNNVEDLFENRLDGDYNGTPGGNYELNFTILGDDLGTGGGTEPGDPDPGDNEDDLVHDDPTGLQEDPAVATDANGNYVVVWVEQDPTVEDPTISDSNIHARRFDRFGNPAGPEFIVNDYRPGEQLDPDVAMDDFGNFVVVWSGEGDFGHPDPRFVESAGVFARVYDANGNPIGEDGGVEVGVNQTRSDTQFQPAVAMNGSGRFVVSWTTRPDNATNNDDGEVYGRVYNLLGDALTNEIRLNTVTDRTQESSDVAMADDGSFVAVWAAYDHPADNNDWGVVGQRFGANGGRIGGEFLVNTYKNDKQLDPHIAMAGGGRFTVSWSSFLEDGNGYGVFGRRYSAAGAALDASGFQVNETTLHYQYESAVSMADDGTMVFTWSSFAQDNVFENDYGVFARIFNPNRSDFGGIGEFQVNAFEAGNQYTSDVAMASNGDFVVVWQGPDNDDAEIPDDPVNPDTDDFDGIYQRVVKIGAPSSGGDGAGAGGDRIPINGNPYYAGDGSNPGINTFVVSGTGGADTFQFTAGNTASSSTLLVNGKKFAIPADTDVIQIEGAGGKDKIVVQGSTGTETAQLYGDGNSEDNNLVYRGVSYSLAAASVEVVELTSGGGNDRADIYAGAVPETYVGRETSALLVASDNSHDYRLANFTRVRFLGDAADSAKLEDSPGVANTLDAYPTDVKLAGSATTHRVFNAGEVLVTASNDPDDVANLFDSAGVDVFTGRMRYDPAREKFASAKMEGQGYINTVSGFRTINAHSSGTVLNAETKELDKAIMYGLSASEGIDTYTGTPDQGTLKSAVFTHTASMFPEIHFVAKNGNDDTATLYDGEGKDRLTSTHVYGRLAGERSDGSDYMHRVVRVRGGVEVVCQSGPDVARFYDSAFDDIFEATPAEAHHYNRKMDLTAKGFPTVFAYASTVKDEEGNIVDPRGTDEGFLSGYDANNDKLEKNGDVTRLYNGVYSIELNDYEKVYATSGSGPAALLAAGEPDWALVKDVAESNSSQSSKEDEVAAIDFFFSQGNE